MSALEACSDSATLDSAPADIDPATGAVAQADSDAMIDATATPQPASTTGGVAWAQGDQFYVGSAPNQQLYKMKGVNYYSSKEPWHTWDMWDPGAIEEDFAYAKRTGANTVRIFVDYNRFNASQDPSVYSVWGPNSKMPLLDQVIARADLSGLKVVVTLFDGLNNVALLTEPAARMQAHVNGIVQHYRNDARIFAFDVMNEPDHIWGKGTCGEPVVQCMQDVTSRLQQIIGYVRAADVPLPGSDLPHLVTVGMYGWWLGGWSNGGSSGRDMSTWPTATGSMDPILNVDYAGFHYYEDINSGGRQQLQAGINAVKQRYPQKPVVIGEIGRADDGVYQDHGVFVRGWTRAHLATYYQDWINVATTQTNIAGAMTWNFIDIDSHWDYSTSPPTQVGDKQDAAALISYEYASPCPPIPLPSSGYPLVLDGQSDGGSPDFHTSPKVYSCQAFSNDYYWGIYDAYHGLKPAGSVFQQSFYGATTQTLEPPTHLHPRLDEGFGPGTPSVTVQWMLGNAATDADVVVRTLRAGDTKDADRTCTWNSECDSGMCVPVFDGVNTSKACRTIADGWAERAPGGGGTQYNVPVAGDGTHYQWWTKAFASPGSWGAGWSTGFTFSVAPQSGYPDVPPGSTFYSYITYLSDKGIMRGYQCGSPGEECDGNSRSNFRPGGTANRGTLARALVLARGWLTSPNVAQHFSDVTPGDPLFPYVEAAVAHGVIGGYNDGTFRPNNPVTRGQMAKMVTIAMGFPTLIAPGAPHFNDTPPDSTFYGYIETLSALGIVNGYSDGTFRPNNPNTRGQLAKVIANSMPKDGGN
ncbi:MAG: S-layer homology domain-containing protein [Byssovorax sp.]